MGIMEKKMETALTVDEGHLAPLGIPPRPNNVILGCEYIKLHMMSVNRDPAKQASTGLRLRSSMT